MIGDQEKDWTELDWSKVDFANSNQSGGWSYSRGGLPLKDHEWAICWIDGRTLARTRYKLPKCLNFIIEQMRRYGRSEVQTEIRRALNI